MRVKRLEIQGFKSFKDKTVVHFDHSITGIVGPNGCGKSNIVDAFFWVMGEQSYKHMRGSGSDDLIFNGSSKYSPLGMAEATLVMETEIPDLENGPAGATAQDIPVHLKTKEISVTRRLYRSGEGEYFINGVPARLKDIQELFMDTGVGAKGYSVIEQGAIGKIVNAKPEERRLLIEEAAGIAKYKARKKESLRKMEATHGNLSRLNDVIQEIERNLGSLERQATKARQYKKYKDELLDREMTWGRRKSQVLRQRLEQLKSARDGMEQELVGLRAELQTTENSIETDRIGQVTETKLAEDLQAEASILSSDLTQSRSALDLSRRRQGDLTTQLQALESEKGDLEASLQIEREKQATREIESQEAETAFRAAGDRAKDADEEARRVRSELQSKRSKLDQSKRELMNGIAQASDMTSRAAALESRLESARAQGERLASQVEEYSAKVTQAHEEAEKAQEAANSIRQRRESLLTEKKVKQSQVQASEQNLRQKEKTRDELARAVTQLRSRMTSLEELAQAHEGFGDGPKAVLDWAKSQGHSKEIRAFADSFDVQDGYEAALEGWLEDLLESLVSDQPELALQAVRELQAEKQGRAAILVSRTHALKTEIPLAEVTKQLTAQGFEVVGPLSQFIKLNKKAGEVATSMAERLFAHVCVVRNFENMPALLAADPKLEKMGGWAVVSLDGQALDPEGVVRGGSSDTGNAASLLGRKRAIADLHTQVEAAELTAQEADAGAVAAREELETIRELLQGLLAEVQSLEIEGAAFDRDVHQMNRSLKDSENQLRQVENESERVRHDIENAVTERAKLDSRLLEITSGRSDLELQISELEGQFRAEEEAAHEQDSELQTLKVSEASLRERAFSLKREVEASRSLMADRQRRLSEIDRILDRASKEHEGFTGGDSELEQRIEELTHKLAETRESLSAAKDRLEQTNAKLSVMLARIKELHKVGDAKNAESNQMALELEKLSSELSHLVQNLEEKYGPGCLDRVVASPIQEEMTDPVITTEMSAEDEQRLGEEVERLRERIRRLGEVNVMAIEEFDEVKKRYDYLLTEREDLLQSIRNLEEAIEHINKTSEERFAKAFQAIAERFERLFPIVFGGGSAKLSLTYPEGSQDILDAGVDILAQPPGKKVSNITLLSGGEKALTAVSLIFSIFMVKPSPFCLLDEVDAPLDDANIGKFNALLREMSVKSQFILITHNKKTMELNDTLYGVTMEEPGVSKMVSIEMQ